MAVVTSERRALSGLYSLVVVRNREYRDHARLVLGYFGAAVTTASSAEAALDALARRRPDFVVVDLSFTGAHDALWLRHHAAQQWPDVPFIALSGGEFSTGALERAGFAAALQKPVNHDVLVDAVLATIAR